MKRRLFSAAAVFTLGLFASAPALATELITNGGFETGNFTGWTVTDFAGGSGSWFVSNSTTTPLSSHLAAGPASGSFYAVTDQFGPGAHALEQTFTVPTLASLVILSFDMFNNDWDSGPIIGSGLNPFAGPNQHSRVDILSALASPFDTGAGVLANYFIGVDAGPDPRPYTTYLFDITSLVGGGGTYKLRFAEVDNQLYFNMGVDNVSVNFTPGAPVPEPSTFLLLGGGILGGLALRRKLKAA